MNTEYIKEFVTLAETKNFWEASERLFMNQSTLSKHIKALEQDLGVELFNRTTRHVELTQYGKAFLPYASTITSAEINSISAIKRMQNINNGLLTIGSIPSMPQYDITTLLSGFKEKYPDTTIKISEDDSSNLLGYLENESCEIIFNREYKSQSDVLTNKYITHIPYKTDAMMAVLPNSHPLSNEGSITLQQLKDETFCLIKEGTLMYSLSLSACQQAGFVPNIIYTSHRIDSIIDMVSKQKCVALLMNKHVEMLTTNSKSKKNEVSAVKITPEICSQISICYRNDKPLSDIALLFLEYVKKALIEL